MKIVGVGGNLRLSPQSKIIDSGGVWASSKWLPRRVLFHDSTYPVHGRRIKTEQKAKIVFAVCWGTELIQLLATLAILHQDYLKKGMNSSNSSYRLGAIYPILQIILVQTS